jgi:hypothetical protein
MKNKVIKLRRRRQVDFENNPMDHLALVMSMYGFSAKFTASTCGWRQPGRVYYRNHLANLRIRDFREGKSPMAIVVLQSLSGKTNEILAQHLGRQEEGVAPLKVDGVKGKPRTFIRRNMLAKASLKAA